MCEATAIVVRFKFKTKTVSKSDADKELYPFHTAHFLPKA